MASIENVKTEKDEEEKKETEEEIQSKSLELRRELDDLLERTSNNMGGGLFETTGEQDLLERTMTEEEFLMLVTLYSEEVIKRTLFLTFPSDPSSPVYSGRLPIHLACDKNAPLSIIQYLLDADTSKQTLVQPDKWGDLPIHTACSRKDSYDVIELLLLNDTTKTSILTKDDNGLLPLHMACRYNASPEVLQILLDNDIYCQPCNTNKHHPFLPPPRRSVLQQDKYGQLPIHTACRCDSEPDAIRLLLKGDSTQSSVMKQDAADRLPIHVAFLRTRNETTLRLLLEAMIVRRMELCGYEQWKHHLQYMIHTMSTTHERDFSASDKLQMVCQVLQEQLLERTHILELVLWKANCVQFCPHHYRNSSLEDDDMESSVKARHRITSGSEIIIRGVIPFLENDPIETLLPMLTAF